MTSPEKWLGMRFEELVRTETCFRGLQLDYENERGERGGSNSNGGISVFVHGERLKGLFLYAEGPSVTGRHYSEFKGSLPFGLDFAMNQQEVHALLGKPIRSEPSKIAPILGPMPPWDEYVLEGIAVDLHYAIDKSCISRIALERD